MKRTIHEENCIWKRLYIKRTIHKEQYKIYDGELYYKKGTRY